MGRWESLVEKKIREAMAEGEFDDLPGKGKPVDLSENPFEDPELRLAHRLLRNAGFAPAFIEERKEIDAGIESARTSLMRAWTIYQRVIESGRADGEALWERALEEFRGRIEALNKRIQLYNLKVPAAAFQRRLVDAQTEVEHAQKTPV